MDSEPPVVLYTQPEKFNTDRLVTVAGAAFMFRVSLCKGGVVRAEFNPDTSSLKARIGKKKPRPGGPPVKPM